MPVQASSRLQAPGDGIVGTDTPLRQPEMYCQYFNINGTNNHASTSVQ